jgi:small subunit ribosomal protein S16
VGAQPTEAVAALLRVTGDWQRFKGLPGGEGTLKVAEPRPDKKAVFDEAAKEAMAEPREGATTTKARGARSEARPAAGRTAKTEAATGEAATPVPSAAESAPAESTPAESTEA